MIAVLIILVPAGLVLPGYFKAGAAWGEWAPEEIKALVGYIPKGLEKLATLWAAPIPDYSFRGWEDRPVPMLSLAYVLSAAAGIAVTIGLIYIIGKILIKKE